MKAAVFARLAGALRRMASEPGFDLAKVVRRIQLPGCWPGAGGDDNGPGAVKVVQLHNEICLEAARAISAALSGRGIGHFFAKGVALLDSGIYDATERSLGDIDLYVRRTHCDVAAGELAKLGYRMFPEEFQAGPPALRSSLAFEQESGLALERVQVDLHLALDRLDRLLPRNEYGIGDDMVAALLTPGSLPVPAVPHHCFILVHQLVHTDMLQLHTLVDFALVSSELTEDGARELWSRCVEFRISGFLRGLIDLLGREFGVRWPSLPETAGAKRQLRLENWLRLVCAAGDAELTEITVARIRRRIWLLDGGIQRVAVLRDVFAPPPEFLRWRWGQVFPRGYLAHAAQLARKAVGR